MSATSTTDALAMTAAEVNAIEQDARREAEEAAEKVREAETALGDDVDSGITPARLAELRQEAEHAQLRVPAAERRAASIREQRGAALREQRAERFRTEMPADMKGRAEEIIGKLDAFETALRELAEATMAHNERVAKWASPGADGVRHGAKTYVPLSAGKLIGVTLYRTLHDAYPREFIAYPGPDMPITRGGDWVDSHGPVDLRKMIRRNA